MGRRIGEFTLLNQVALPLEMETFAFEVEQVAFTYHNDQGEGFDIRVDPAMGVRLLGEDILPSASLLGCGWGPDNTRWQRLREGGNMAWKGRYEMRPASKELQRGGVCLKSWCAETAAATPQVQHRCRTTWRGAS